MAKSSILLLALLAATSSAFTAPQFATRAVGKPAPAKKAAPVKKVVAKPTKVVAKKVATKAVVKPVAKPVVRKAVVKPVAKPVVRKAVVKPVAKPVVKKAVAKPVVKKAVAKPVVKKVVAKKGPSKPNALANFLSDAKRKAPPKPKFSVKAPPASRSKKSGVFVYDDGLTAIERTQRASIPAFLSGSAKPSKVKSDLRPELYATGDEYFFSPYDTTVATVTLFLLLSVIVKAGSGQ
jgi:hypothetical protein